MSNLGQIFFTSEGKTIDVEYMTKDEIYSIYGIELIDGKEYSNNKEVFKTPDGLRYVQIGEDHAFMKSDIDGKRYYICEEC